MTNNKVTKEHIEKILSEADIEVSDIGGSTTLVVCTLKNGWRFIESSSCVDPNNYSREIGASICMEKIEGKLWELEGYLLINEMARRSGEVCWSVNKVFVKKIGGNMVEDLGWKFYASSDRGDRSGYFDTYDETVDWIASLEG